MQKKIIVTGGAGFIGSNIVDALNRRGREDVIVVDEPGNPVKDANLDGLSYLDYLNKFDFRHRVLEGQLKDVEAIFHMGACSSTTETDEAFLRDNNVAYTRDLCEWCLANDARFVYASSAATYGDGSLGYSDEDAVTPTLQPLNLYGWSKQHFDVEALEKGWLNRVVGLKYFNVYGPREDHKEDMRSVVNKAHGQILETGKVNLFKSYKPDYADGEQLRDFIYVKDAVDVTLWFWDNPGVNGLFNCGTGKARNWIDLVSAVFRAMDREPNIEFIEMPESIREKYQYFTQADAAKLRAAGYDAPFTSLEDGVGEYVRGYLAGKAGR